jgi:hypothetical protein
MSGGLSGGLLSTKKWIALQDCPAVKSGLPEQRPKFFFRVTRVTRLWRFWTPNANSGNEKTPFFTGFASF